MDNATDKLKQLLKIISTNYNRTLTDPQVELIKMMAKQYGFNQFNTAVMAHMTDPNQGMFFPTMAHIAGKVPKQNQDLMIESKGSLHWCENTQALLDKYPTRINK
jgi:hypothetical protein